MKRIIPFLLVFFMLTNFCAIFSLAQGFYVSGDVDDDGNVTSTDSLLALQNSIGSINLSGDQFDLADVNCDNTVASVDSLLILQRSVNTLEKLPFLNNTVKTTSILNNGAYQEDQTADTSFKIITKGLKHKTIYNIVYKSVCSRSDHYAHKDVIRFVASLQGLVNRDFGLTHTSIINIQYGSDDTVWRNYMMGKGKTFEGFSMVDITSFDAFFSAFKEQIMHAGIILWDQNAPATANVAATICGLDGYLPVRYETFSDSLYTYLTSRGVSVKQSLCDMFTGSGILPGTNIQSSGSKKCDPYLWALEKYMPRCSSNYIAYMPDGTTNSRGNPYAEISNDAKNPLKNSIPSHDYLIARRAFFFDLTPYAYEAPCDDPNQPIGTDRQTFYKIFEKRYNLSNGSIGQMIGFVPWHLKYTCETPNSGNIFTGTPEAVPMEWLMVQIASCYNVTTEADAAGTCWMFNASFYYKYCTQVQSFQNSDSYPDAVTEHFSNMKHYMCFYMGDYDCSAWLKSAGYNLWNNSARGDLPLMWGFNPNLSLRFPAAFEYFYETRSDNDFFVAGDSGAGYVNPSAFYYGNMGRTMPTDAEKWYDYCDYFYKKFDLNTTGFLINATAALGTEVLEGYSRFSPVVTFHNVSVNETRLCQFNNAVYCYMKDTSAGDYMVDDDYTCTELSVREMHQHLCWGSGAGNGYGPYNFSAYRTILHSPAEIVSLYETLCEYESNIQNPVSFYVVDPENFADLVLQSGQATKITS